MKLFDEQEVIRSTKRELQQNDRAMKQLIPNWKYDTLAECMSMQTQIVNLVNNLDERYDVYFDHIYDLLRRLRNVYFKLHFYGYN